MRPGYAGAVELRNWGGTYRYRARALHRPRTLAELRGLVISCRRLRVAGSRHSFNAIGDGDELVTLDDLSGDLAIDHDAQIVSLPSHLRYGQLAERLAGEGLALANLASLPHISVAGAVATATHGSGIANGNLATAIAALELVRSDGQIVWLRRGSPDFDGAVVALGALGVVTRVVLDVQPAYEISQHVYEGLAWDALFEHFDAIFAAAYSVSVFLGWRDRIDQVWLKRRAADHPAPDELFGAAPAPADRHPIAGLDPANCTPQLGRPGPWMDRLPHFRMGFTPSSGQEIQSEYHLAREQAVEAIDALRSIRPGFQQLVQVSELRTIAADTLWLSPQHGRDTVAIHFTWAPDQRAVERALAEIEAILIPLGARPHWGKLFLAGAADLAGSYERLADFSAMVQRFDPHGKFRNRWLEAHLLGAD
ncbi:MAG: FAD-binding protein [Solirubrobacterales bacterium]|nr:FAD-binding protein [Solirubrobacterales bacterium]